MSVMLFISSGIMMLGGLLFAVGLAAGLAAGGAGGPGPLRAAPAFAVGLVYAVMGLVNLLPAVFLWRFASRAQAYATGLTQNLLEEALDAQRSYWKFMGIFVIVAFVFAICAVAVVAIAAIAFMRATAR
jgi:hypothetical protein